MNIIDIMNDDRFFKPLFRDISTWKAWEVFLKALFGISLIDKSEKRLFQQCTGLKKLRETPANGLYPATEKP